MSLAWAALALVVPVALGAIAGALRLLDERAIDPINRFALYFAFPALIAQGLLASALALPSSIGFWVIVPLALAISLIAARLLAPRSAPTLALVLAFGNVAYLGLPVVESALGSSALPIASLAVALHVLLALTVGPTLLLAWSGSSRSLAGALPRLARQPLVWAPLAGLLGRLLPAGAREGAEAVLAPLGRSAAPVALFLLGLYLFVHRARLRTIDAADVTHVAFKSVLLPALTLGLAFAARRIGVIDPLEARILVVLSAMPAAITTFAMAHEHAAGAERVSRAIVTTTIVSVATIPLAIAIALRVLA